LNNLWQGHVSLCTAIWATSSALPPNPGPEQEIQTAGESNEVLKHLNVDYWTASFNAKVISNLMHIPINVSWVIKEWFAGVLKQLILFKLNYGCYVCQNAKKV
jgi:hypothetical protein